MFKEFVHINRLERYHWSWGGWEIPRGEKITPEEREKALEEARIKEAAARDQQRLRESLWDENDRKVLLWWWAFQVIDGADMEQMAQIPLEPHILDENIGDPLEFWEDLDRIIELSGRRIRVGKEIKREMPPQFVDALFWAVLAAHIMGLNFYIETDANGQPVLVDNENPTTPDRQQLMEELQETLRSKGTYQRDSMKSGDAGILQENNHNIPKIHTYIASAAFFANSNAMWVKGLSGYKTDLLQGVTARAWGGKPTKEMIKNDPMLGAGDRSFLLAFWEDTETNRAALQMLNSRNLEGIKSIEAHPNFRTGAEKMNNIIRNPSQIIMPAVMSAAAIGVLAIGLKMVLGKDSEWWKRLLGLVVTSMGVAFTGPVIGNLMTATGMAKKSREASLGLPVGWRDTFPAQFGQLTRDVEDIAERLTAGSNQWIPMILGEHGPKITRYPVGAMLSVLNPHEEKYDAYAPDTPLKDEIEQTLWELKIENPENPQVLHELVRYSFVRFQRLYPDEKDPEKLTLPEILSKINQKDKWINPYVKQAKELVSDEPEKFDALSIFAANPTTWWAFKLQDLREHFDPYDEYSENKQKEEITCALQEAIPHERYLIIKKYLKIIFPKEKVARDNFETWLTLREFLEKEKA